MYFICININQHLLGWLKIGKFENLEELQASI